MYFWFIQFVFSAFALQGNVDVSISNSNLVTISFSGFSGSSSPADSNDQVLFEAFISAPRPDPIRGCRHWQIQRIITPTSLSSLTSTSCASIQISLAPSPSLNHTIGGNVVVRVYYADYLKSPEGFNILCFQSIPPLVVTGSADFSLTGSNIPISNAVYPVFGDVVVPSSFSIVSANTTDC